MNEPRREVAIERVQRAIETCYRTGTLRSAADGTNHEILTVSIPPAEGAALRDWVVREGAGSTLEVGLAYGISALHVCEGLLLGDHDRPGHTVIDPFQSRRFSNLGLQTLADTGLEGIVTHHAELSQWVLPRLMREQQTFDLAFVDGNHRFDFVFVDLFFLGHLVKGGGIVFLDDYDLPGIERAVAFFVHNLGWQIEEVSPPVEGHTWAVLRTPTTPKERDYHYFVPF